MKHPRSSRYVGWIVILLASLMMVSCSGCVSHRSSSTRIMSVMNQTSRGFSAHYHKLSGTETYTITVKENEPLSLHVKTTTEEGSLKIIVGQKGKTPVYEGNENSPVRDFTISLKEAGKYQVVLKANKHKGSYAFSW